MENTNTQWETSVKDAVEKAVKKIFDTVLPPKETQKNRVMVGSARKSVATNCYYQPHNLRIYFDFSRELFLKKNPGSDLGQGRFGLVNSKEMALDNYHDCRLVIKKTQIEITNKIEHKRWYVIVLDDTTRAQTMHILVSKVLEAVEVLKLFIKEFNCSDVPVSQLKPLNVRSEDKVKGTEIIDRLPLKMAWHGDLTKKVYNEPVVEFKDTVSAATYFENAALHVVEPEINSRLDKIDEHLGKFVDVIGQTNNALGKVNETIGWLDKNIEGHKEVLLGMKDVNQANLETSKNINESINKLSNVTSENTSRIVSGMHEITASNETLSEQLTDLKVDVNCTAAKIVSEIDNRNIAHEDLGDGLIEQCDNGSQELFLFKPPTIKKNPVTIPIYEPSFIERMVDKLKRFWR